MATVQHAPSFLRTNVAGKDSAMFVNSAMFVRRVIRRGLSGICKMESTDERGLSTLEWILLVAAVGGLATIGVIVVRGAADDTGDRTQSQAEFAGEGGALRTLQGKVNEIMTQERGISGKGSDLNRFNVCLRNFSGVAGTAQVSLYEDLSALQDKHSEVYSYHPVSVDWDTAGKFPILKRGDRKVVWCRVRHKTSGLCASIADETPVSDPPNDGYRDTNMYRSGSFNNKVSPNTPHNFPLSNTFCKGRV